ncbi:sigma-70 family RNA polymerase sigma factor [Amycolatopsis jejuensis]|uniref:sigma-70 family RNA polymerase sigma factor n=1 Tax=Amycolatopsis jejuensis TaxID=330084 RepID=UPI0006903FE7|nr:sigma-70 family RNA polymerase sigma factor [Amycolatopsis jejuensis]
MVTISDKSRLCQTLLQRAGQGDTAAFAELYDCTAPAVYGLVRSILPDVRQAEEATCAVYRHAWQTASRYNPGRDDVSTLLMTVARRYALDRLRTALPHDGASGRPAPDDDVANLLRRLSGAEPVAALPVASGEALVLIYFRGQTLAEAAELLGIPADTVISRLNDAFSRLRRRHRSHSADAPTCAGQTHLPRQRENTR